MEMDKLLVSWSGGKDSALMLHELQQTRRYEIAALLTTVTADYDRVSMHGVRRALLERQADALGLALETVFIAADTSDEAYGARMREVLERYAQVGISAVAFGDIFLEDVRRYREEKLAQVGMQGLFPLWGRDTAELARAFLDRGFRAVVTCVDSQALDGAFVGRDFDERFLAQLPPQVDPCGENGAFHSFVYNGPIFQQPVPYVKGEVVVRENRFYYCDLVPAT